MTKKMQELCNKREELLAKGKSFVAENKMEELKAITNEIKLLDEEISALEVLENAEKGAVVVNKTADGKKFKNLSEQLNAIKNAAYGRVDERLKNELSGGLNTNNDADGGFAIQSDFVGAILDRAFEQSEIVSRCTTRAITSNSNRANWVTLDDSEDATKEGVVVAGGVQVYWAKEGESVPATKPKYKADELKLAKLMGFCYATEEMLQDVPFTAQLVEDAFSEAVQGSLTNAILNGTGTGDSGALQPYGILKSQAVVEVAPADASKVTAQDFLSMKARMRKKNWANAVWVMHPDIEADLPLMKDEDGNLMFIPAGGLNGATTDTLLGRPVVYDEFVASKGSKGDILLADFSEYLLIKKGEERKDWSMHVAFLTDEQVFRIVMRVNGKPMRNNTYSVRNSTNRRGAFVTLGARGL